MVFYKIFENQFFHKPRSKSISNMIGLLDPSVFMFPTVWANVKADIEEFKMEAVKSEIL